MITRKIGGRGLISCEKCIRAEENNIGWYIKNAVEPLLMAVRQGEIVVSEHSIRKDQYKKMEMTETEEKWREKVMHGQYVRDLGEDEEIDIGMTWKWMRKSDLKPETEALICAAQEQALRTNYVKCKIDKTAESQMCRLCNEKGESVSHITSECKMLAQKEYKRRHDNVARFIHWKLCGKYKLERSDKWYEHNAEGIIENDEVKILWDFMIQCDRPVEHRKPDIVVLEKEKKKCIIIDVAIPGDNRIRKKEKEKIEKYQELKNEITKMWRMKTVIVIPVVIGALGAVTKRIEGWIDKMELNIRVEHLQKTSLLGTARILRRVLNY